MRCNLTLSFPGKKFLTATTQRENYERGTIESLTDVKTKCLALLQEAEKSNMYQVYYGTKVDLTSEIPDKKTSNLLFKLVLIHSVQEVRLC